ncbi:hypothetical protein B0H34DRAFT_796382 [Crassisporium funariophilum]|nr:hypothetical protein B0H34DRAFT_796382 [Crassisporium funariophilum]
MVYLSAQEYDRPQAFVAAVSAVGTPSFPSPPDFSAQSSFPPPLKIAEQLSFPPLPDFLAQPSFPPPPNFLLEPSFPPPPDFAEPPSFPPPPDFAEPPSFPPPPDFSVEPTFAPPNFNEMNSADSPDHNIGGEDLIFLAFPNFHIDQVLEFPHLPEFTVGHKTSDLATEFPPLPAHQTSDFPAFPDLTAGQSDLLPNADTDATNSAFPPLPNFVESSQTSNTQPVPPIPKVAVSSDFPPLPKFFDMEVDSVGRPNPTVIGVGSSFPPIPNFNTDLGPSDPTPRKRGRSPSLGAEPKSKKSKQPAPSKKVAGKIASKAVCQKYRRLGDYREVDMTWIQPSIGELYAAHTAIRTTDGNRLPYHVGYARAVEEADREVARLKSLEDSAAEAVDHLLKATLSPVLTHYGVTDDDIPMYIEPASNTASSIQEQDHKEGAFTRILELFQKRTKTTMQPRDPLEDALKIWSSLTPEIKVAFPQQVFDNNNIDLR